MNVATSSAAIPRRNGPRGGAVAADQAEVHATVLHQVAAGVVGDHRMADAVMAELPGGERGALVARPRLVDPDMDADALVMGHVDRRGGRARNRSR